MADPEAVAKVIKLLSSFLGMHTFLRRPSHATSAQCSSVWLLTFAITFELCLKSNAHKTYCDERAVHVTLKLSSCFELAVHKQVRSSIKHHQRAHGAV